MLHTYFLEKSIAIDYIFSLAFECRKNWPLSSIEELNRVILVLFEIQEVTCNIIFQPLKEVPEKMALVPTYLDIHIKPLIYHIILCCSIYNSTIVPNTIQLKLEFYIQQPLVNLQRNRHCFGDISRNFLEALYFCVTH